MSVEPTPQVSVVGWATDGPVDAHSGRLAPAFNALLPHGTAPSALLALHGWLADALIAATSNPEPHHVHLHFRVLRVARVTETSAEASPNPSGIVVVQDPDLVVEPDEHPHVTQRVASYALVTSARGVLLTAYSDRTNAAGTWGFPGGGIDPGESPRRRCTAKSGKKPASTSRSRDCSACVPHAGSGALRPADWRITTRCGSSIAPIALTQPIR